MFGWNFLGDWFKGNNNLDTTIVADDQIVLPYDYDTYEWWNPFDWAGNYDKSIDDYKARKSNESGKKITNIIVFTMVSAFIFEIFLRRKRR